MSPKTDTQKSAKSATVTAKAVKGFTDEERAAMKERAQELKAEARRGARAEKADGESEVLAENLVRDARVRQGRQCRLLLPKRAQVQGEVRDVRLQRQGEPRRRHRVAGRLRAEGVDRRRRGKDRRAREESGELRRSLHCQAQGSAPPNTRLKLTAPV